MDEFMRNTCSHDSPHDLDFGEDNFLFPTIYFINGGNDYIKMV